MKMKKIAQRVRRVTRPGRNASETQEEEALVQEEALQDDEAGFEGEDDFEDEDYDQGSVADLDDYDGGSDDDDHQGADKGRDEEDVEEGVEDELKDLGVRARWKVQKALREIVRGAKEIYLERTSIGDAGANVLAKAVAQSKTLEILNLDSNDIHDAGAIELAKAVATNKTLTSLDLGDNKIGSEGAKALAGSLAASRTLTTLNLGLNKIGSEGAEALADSLAASRTLTTLMLWSNNIGDEGAKALAGSLAASRTLTTLNLWRNNIGSEGAEALAGSLATSRTLTTLDLVYNNIGSEGAKALAGSLAASRTLTTLGLQSNNIGDEGVKALAGSLATSRTLTTLFLGANSIGVEGATALAGSLAASRTLTTLNLKFNRIGSEGAKALAGSLAASRTLTSFDISQNAIGVEGYECLARLLDENFTLTSLIFGMPGLPSPLRFEDLWSRKVGEKEDGGAIREPLTRSERVQEIGEYLVEESGSRWTSAAHKLARRHAHIFAIFLSMLVAHDPDAAPSFNHHELWLQHDEEEEDDDAVPIIHALLDCRPHGTEFALPEAFLQEFITGKLTLKDGLALMATEDNSGRSARSLALANKNTKGWAKTYGTYLERYSIAEGPPVHESKTCAVHFATDIRTNTPVAIKIMRERKQYDREIEARETKDGSQPQGCLKLLNRDSKNDRKRLDKEMCLVMPRGSRSLFEAINTERFAGRDLDKIREISFKIASALRNLHDSGRIHGDIKPRNAVRTSASSANTFEDNKEGRQMVNQNWRDSPTGEGLDRKEKWELIDLDASVVIGDEVSEKASTGYVSPEVARYIFEGDERPKGATSQDVWGFGVLLYQLLSGTKLFMVDESDDNLVHDHDKRKLMNWLGLDEDHMKRIKKRKAIRGAEDGLSGSESEIEAARDLARVCLRGKAGERLGLEEIPKHPFFDKIWKSKLDSSSQAAEAPSRRESRKKHKSGSRRASERRTSRASGRTSGRTPGRTSGPKPRSARLSQHLSLRAKMARPMKDRIVSFHRSIEDMNSRFDSIRKTLRLSQRNEQKYPKWYHEPALRTDLLELPTYHFFLSHMQQQAAGIVKDLGAGLERNQMTAWVDMRALDITMGAMQRGVMSSQCFVMVLTTDVLFRPFCLAELKFAVEHFERMEGGLSKHIFFLAEEDERFSPWRAIEDEPWIWDDTDKDDETLRLKTKSELDKAGVLHDLANEADDEDFAKSCKLEAIKARKRAKEFKCRLARRKLEEDLSSALFDLSASAADGDDDISVHDSADNYKEYFDAAKLALEECYIIPYRRRHFEEEAMLRELASLAGFKTRAPEKPGVVPELYVLGMAESLVTRALKKELKSESSINAAEVVVIVLEPGCCPAVHDALGIESIDEDNELLKSKKFLAVENGWNYGGEEKEQFHVDLQKKLFDHLEALSCHGSHEGDFSATSMESMHEGIPRRNYWEEHELKALILELELRACRVVEDSII